MTNSDRAWARQQYTKAYCDEHAKRMDRVAGQFEARWNARGDVADYNLAESARSEAAAFRAIWAE